MFYRLLAVLMLTSASGSLWAGEGCGRHLIMGVPVKSDVVLCKGTFALGFDESKRAPEWASFYLTRGSVKAFVSPRSKFLLDDEVSPDDQAYPTDYIGWGYEPTLLAPVASVDTSKVSMKESYELTNVVPQLPELSKGGWAELESAMRGLASRYEGVYVVAGTYGNAPASIAPTPSRKGAVSYGPSEWQGDKQLFRGDDIAGPTGAMLNSRVVVPGHFYMAYLVPSLGVGGAFWVPHKAIPKTKVYDYHLTIDALEDKIGIDLFSALTDELEIQIESREQLSLIGGGK